MANGFGSSLLLQHSHETGPNHPVHIYLQSALTKSDLKTFASFFPIFKRSLFWDNNIILDGRLKLKPRDLWAFLPLSLSCPLRLYTRNDSPPPKSPTKKKLILSDLWAILIVDLHCRSSRSIKLGKWGLY